MRIIIFLALMAPTFVKCYGQNVSNCNKYEVNLYDSIAITFDADCGCDVGNCAYIELTLQDSSDQNYECWGVFFDHNLKDVQTNYIDIYSLDPCTEEFELPFWPNNDFIELSEYQSGGTVEFLICTSENPLYKDSILVLNFQQTDENCFLIDCSLDITPPTVDCNSDISIDLMNISDIQITDLIKASDNCSQINISSNLHELSCKDIGTTYLEISVTDESQNRTSAKCKITLTDDFGNCSNTNLCCDYKYYFDQRVVINEIIINNASTFICGSILNESNLWQGLIAKINNNKKIEWQYLTENYHRINDFTITSDDNSESFNIVFCGESTYGDDDRGFVGAIDQSGNLLNIYQSDLEKDLFNRIIFNPYSSNPNFPVYMIGRVGGDGSILVNLDKTGGINWSRYYYLGNSEFSSFDYWILPDKDGNILIGGQNRSAFDAIHLKVSGNDGTILKSIKINEQHTGIDACIINNDLYATLSHTTSSNETTLNLFSKNMNPLKSFRFCSNDFIPKSIFYFNGTTYLAGINNNRNPIELQLNIDSNGDIIGNTKFINDMASVGPRVDLAHSSTVSAFSFTGSPLHKSGIILDNPVVRKICNTGGFECLEERNISISNITVNDNPYKLFPNMIADLFIDESITYTSSCCDSLDTDFLSCTDNQYRYLENTGVEIPNSIHWGNISKRGDVTFDDSGNRYLAATIDNGLGADIHILKNDVSVYNISGNDYDQISEIQVVGDYIYLTGSYHSDFLDFGLDNNNDPIIIEGIGNVGINDPGARQPNGFVVKLKMDFTPIWAFNLGEVWVDNVEDITILSDTEFAITGITRLNRDFDPTTSETRPTDNSAGIKAYIAKYSSNNAEELPTCDWVQTVYPLDGSSGSATGLGITHDANGNIYAVGDMRVSALATGPQQIELSNAPPTTFPTDILPNKIHGYIVAFTDKGQFIWSDQIYIDQNLPDRGICTRDIICSDNQLLIVGTNHTARYDIATNNRKSFYYKKGLDLEEITAITTSQFAIVGMNNGISDNIALSTSDNIIPASNLEQLIYVTDDQFTTLQYVTPGFDSRINRGLTISSYGDSIYVGGEVLNSTGNAFYYNYPLDGFLQESLTINSDFSYVAAVYTPSCNTYNLSECCAPVNITEGTPTSNDYCCQFVIDNIDITNLYAIDIAIPDSLDLLFKEFSVSSNSQVILNQTESNNIELILNDTISVDNLTIQYCLQGDKLSILNEIPFSIIRHYESDDMHSICMDQFLTSCVLQKDFNLFDISQIETSCIKEDLYELEFTLSNASDGDVIESAIINIFNPGINITDCSSASIGNSDSHTLDFDPLKPDESRSLCLLLSSEFPITSTTFVEFSTTSLSEGSTETFLSDTLTTPLQPCCNSCTDDNIVLAKTDSCCYNLSLRGLCNSNNYNGFQIHPRGSESLLMLDSIYPPFLWNQCRASLGVICLSLEPQYLMVNQMDLAKICFESPEEELILDYILLDKDGKNSTNCLGTVQIDNCIITNNFDTRETNSSFQIIPNPVTDQIVIKSSNNLLAGYEIYNINGRRIIRVDNLSASRHFIDMTQHDSGVYIIKLISHSSATESFKLIKL